MKNLKNYYSFINEAYDEKKHDEIKTIRAASQITFVKHLSKFVSIIDDLKRLDFKALKHSLKNKKGFEKLETILTELSMLKKLKTENDKLTFKDLEDYEFKPKQILKLLDDDDVIEYLKHDKNVKNKLEKLDNLIKFLEEYEEFRKK